ncbi:hypothetical protein [Levilactobacillus namurensis]|uniref:hypothetical protein n=1 Tax=Levilactobacillus namurensis TaxID=380393 RepID=UPI0026F0D65A|nr:hypothetical protein [Levilactobacillus namurensis]
MMISEERKNWIISNLRKTKPSEFPSLEFEDDSNKRPKWLDELTDTESNWYIDYVMSLSEEQLLNMMAKE